MSAGGPTILLDVFLTNQRRKRMIEAALAQTELPAEDYPLYVLVGAEGPWTPTGLARRLEMPLSTMLFRLGRLERRGHSERVPNPDDRRSYLIRLTPEGEQLLGEARPAFRDYAEAVEGRLGSEPVGSLRAALEQLRDAITAELESRVPPPETPRG
jgi:DNA-binding MarR family transcriptional regulator